MRLAVSPEILILRKRPPMRASAPPPTPWCRMTRRKAPSQPRRGTRMSPSVSFATRTRCKWA